MHEIGTSSPRNPGGRGQALAPVETLDEHPYRGHGNLVAHSGASAPVERGVRRNGGGDRNPSTAIDARRRGRTDPVRRESRRCSARSGAGPGRRLECGEPGRRGDRGRVCRRALHRIATDGRRRAARRGGLGCDDNLLRAARRDRRGCDAWRVLRVAGGRWVGRRCARAGHRSERVACGGDCTVAHGRHCGRCLGRPKCASAHAAKSVRPPASRRNRLPVNIYPEDPVGGEAAGWRAPADRLAGHSDETAFVIEHPTVEVHPLRRAIEATGIGVWEHVLPRGPSAIDERCAEILGWTGAGERTFERLLGSVHPEERERVTAAFKRALVPDGPGAGAFAVEHRIVRRAGEVRWVGSRGLVEFAGEGGARRPARIVGTMLDLTPHKRTEAALRAAMDEMRRRSNEVDVQARALHASAERLRLAIRAAHICLWDYDVTARRLEWTEECRALFGLASDAEVTHEGFLAAVHPEDRERVARAIDRAVREDVEYRVVRPDGGERWVAAVGDCLYDPAGQAVRFLGVMIDVTDRRRAEAQLRESEERFRQLAESIDDVFWIYDALGARQIYVSPGYARLYGRDPQELYANPRAWLQSLHPDDRQRVEQAYAVHLSQSEFDREYRVTGSRGVRWVRERGFAVRDGVGRTIRMVGVAQDITDRKHAEEALQEADRRKNEFLAILAHELRGPLAPLGNAVELLRLLADSHPDLRPIQGMLARQVDHLTRLVDDLVDLARIFHGTLAVRIEPVDAAMVVERALELARPLIEARRQTLAVEIAPGPLPLRGDLVRLTQALANLLHNAAKYTPPEGRIEVSAALERGEAVLTVSDSGIGIPADKLEQVFGLFVQGPGAEATEGGLGVGLTLVRRVVELHRGNVRATSAGPGEGSRFTIRLPLAAPDAADAPAEAPELAPRRRRCRILVVDDNRDSARMRQ